MAFFFVSMQAYGPAGHTLSTSLAVFSEIASILGSCQGLTPHLQPVAPNLGSLWSFPSTWGVVVSLQFDAV